MPPPHQILQMCPAANCKSAKSIVTYNTVLQKAPKCDERRVETDEIDAIEGNSEPTLEGGGV